jgi:hypothetical protein
MPAPIALFVYNRLWHTKQTIASLLKNELAEVSELFVFSDGPKNNETTRGVEETRSYLRTLQGFKAVTIIEREVNFGLAKSIITGVTQILDKFDSVIVVEDDLVTSPFFLRYMNDALDLYKDEIEVISVHGYIWPVKKKLPDTFFLRGADCWGWGTWKRAWKLFEPDGKKLLAELESRKLTRDFDFNGGYPYTKMLRDQIKGRNNSWAIRWSASAFLLEKLTLFPGESYVNNIGNDDSGTHSRSSSKKDYETSLKLTAPKLVKLKPVEDTGARKIIEEHFQEIKTSLMVKIVRRIKSIISHVS